MSKNRMGRPPLENPASEVLGTVRLTPDQRTSYVQAAELEDMKLAAWVKKALDKAAARVLKTKN